jgi:hypothetical protein
MSNKTNLILDFAIFTAFLLADTPHLTGQTIHEWLALAFAAAIVTHLLFHWKWIITIGGQFFKKLFHKSRLNFVVDVLFFVAMIGTIFSGVLISKEALPALGLQLSALGGGWKMIHKLTADASVILLGIHFAMHWKWVITSIGCYLVAPIRGLFQRSAPKSSPVLQSVNSDEH